MHGNWHVHENLVCVDCGVMVYPRATCIKWQTSAEECSLPSLVLCRVCEAVSADVQAC